MASPRIVSEIKTSFIMNRLASVLLVLSLQENILQFPDEVLRLILHQVPSLNEVFQTCSRLYEIGCQAKFYCVTFESHKTNSCMEVNSKLAH